MDNSVLDKSHPDVFHQSTEVHEYIFIVHNKIKEMPPINDFTKR